MNITELIKAVGEDKISVQELLPAVTTVTARRGSSAVTFLTTHMTPRDILVGDGEVGLVLWIKREDLPEKKTS